jgi:hypothetical protein
MTSREGELIPHPVLCCPPSACAAMRYVPARGVPARAPVTSVPAAAVPGTSACWLVPEPPVVLTKVITSPSSARTSRFAGQQASPLTAGTPSPSHGLQDQGPVPGVAVEVAGGAVRDCQCRQQGQAGFGDERAHPASRARLPMVITSCSSGS